VTEESKGKEKVRGSVITAGSQDIGQESAQNPKGFSMRVTIVVRRVTRQRSASHRKEVVKEKDSMK
jgi:short-subunit dehydrogenase